MSSLSGGTAALIRYRDQRSMMLRKSLSKPYLKQQLPFGHIGGESVHFGRRL